MDLHALSRRDLQALAKRNGVKANQTNAAMAHALAALPKVCLRSFESPSFARVRSVHC